MNKDNKPFIISNSDVKINANKGISILTKNKAKNVTTTNNL